MESLQDSFTFTVGKLDAGMAILIGERAHLIEFPSILLPNGATTGSIVNISVTQNHSEEKRRETEFWQLQNAILQEFGENKPSPPNLQLRHVTQTSVTLEWPHIELATAKLRSLDIYRNGERLASIPSPNTNTSTKLSGLQTDEEYTFQLVLRTTAGTFPSNLIRVRTHTMQDTSGISVCFGNVQDEVLLENSKMALREMGAKWSDKIQIDTTHFICTTPAATPNGAQASGSAAGAPGVEYQRALQLSIPVLYPDWIIACHAEKRMVPIGPFDLRSERVPARTQSLSQVTLERNNSNGALSSKRQSMPVNTPPSSTANFVNQGSGSDGGSPVAARQKFEATPEEPNEDGEAEAGSKSEKRKSRGMMNKDFKFPTPVSSPVQTRTPGRQDSEDLTKVTQNAKAEIEVTEDAPPPRAMTPSNIEVPPPPPVEKERSNSGGTLEDADDEVGDTVEVDLS